MENNLSFGETSPGFVQMERVAVEGSLTVSLSFRTTSSDGLILYLREITGFHFMSLSMEDGVLYLYAFPDTKIVARNPETQEDIKVNDNKWHTVSITVVDDPRSLVILQLDDFYVLDSGDIDNIPMIHGAEYEAFFGGLSDGLRSELQSDVFQTGFPFFGCIRDAMVGDSYVDFMEAVETTGASLGECGVLAPVQDNEDSEAGGQEGPPKTPEPEEEVYNPVELFPGLYPEETPRKEGQCALPVMPALDTDLNMDSGFRLVVLSQIVK